MSGHVCLSLGRLIDAHNRYQDALSLWEPKFRVAAMQPADPHLATLSQDYLVLLLLGYLDQARLRRREALTEAKWLSPFNRAVAPVNVLGR